MGSGDRVRPAQPLLDPPQGRVGHLVAGRATSDHSPLQLDWFVFVVVFGKICEWLPQAWGQRKSRDAESFYLKDDDRVTEPNVLLHGSSQGQTTHARQNFANPEKRAFRAEAFEKKSVGYGGEATAHGCLLVSKKGWTQPGEGIMLGGQINDKLQRFALHS